MLPISLLLAAGLAQDGAAAPPQDQAISTYAPDFFSAARPGNAMDMVDRLPGFSFDGSGNVRGLSGAAGNVLIDGRRPASKSDPLSDVLGRVPANQVLRIDVIRGGAPGIDMQRKPVVANVIRDPKGGINGAVELADRLILDAEGRNEFGLEAEVGARFGARVIEASLEYERGDGHDRAFTHRRRQTPSGAPMLDSRIASDQPATEFATTAAFETPLRSGDLAVNARAYRNTRDITERDDFDLPRGLGILREAYRGQGGEVGGRYVVPIMDGLAIEAVALRSWRENETLATSTQGEARSGYRRSDESGETVGRAVVRVQRWATISFETGLEAASNWLEGDSALVIDGVLTDVPGSRARIEERRGEGFASGVWQVAPSLALEAGLRMEISDFSPRRGEEARFDFAKPSAVLTWTPTPERLVQVRIERDVGQLNFNDFVAEASLNNGSVTGGAALLTPTQTLRAELAFEQQFGERGAFAAAISRERLDDVIDRGPVTGPEGTFDIRRNIGSGVRDVLEVNSTLPLDWGGVPGGLIKAGFKAVRSELTDPTTGLQREFSGQAALEWNAAFTQDLPEWNATWGVNVSGATERTTYRFDRTEAWRAEPYASAFVDYTPRSDMTLRLEINNLTARPSWNMREVYSGPRRVSDLQYVERRDDETYRAVRLSFRQSFN